MQLYVIITKTKRKNRKGSLKSQKRPKIKINKDIPTITTLKHRAHIFPGLTCADTTHPKTNKFHTTFMKVQSHTICHINH